MGMLFNTPTTLQALEMVNSAFLPAKFKAFQKAVTDQAPWALTLQTAFQNLSTAVVGGVGSIYSVAMMHPLYLDFDTNSKPGKDASTRWKNWLSFLDSNGNGTLTWSAVIAKAISASIIDNTCNGIEYFAVPGPSLSVSVAYFVPGQATTPNPPAAIYTTIITVTTNTVDQLSTILRDSSRRPRTPRNRGSV